MEPDPDEHIPFGQEDLQWGSGIKETERHKSTAPGAKYNKLSEQARRLMAGESQCAMFCGGKKCKYCTSHTWKPEQMAIKGLYSQWVTDNILAMARPSNHGLDKDKILDQFTDNNIKTVINLQQPGEHASCGYGNDASGFSYNPQRLMDKEIFFYNFAWQDYGIAPMSTLLDIVKVMQFGVSMGKVAVHCHAGLGRTGLLIACYLVYNNRMGAGDAVRYVRSRRANSIQTRQQVHTVYDFETHLKPFRTIFPSRISEASEVTLKHFLNRQSHLLHGFEARKLKHIPKVVYVCCERLLELAGKGQSLSKTSTSSGPPHSSMSTDDNLNSSGRPSHLRTSVSQQSLPSGDHLKIPNQQVSVSFEDLSDARFKRMMSRDEDCSSSCGGSSQLDQDPSTQLPPTQEVDAQKEAADKGTRECLEQKGGVKKEAVGSGTLEGVMKGGVKEEGVVNSNGVQSELVEARDSSKGEKFEVKAGEEGKRKDGADDDDNCIVFGGNDGKKTKSAERGKKKDQTLSPRGRDVTPRGTSADRRNGHIDSRTKSPDSATKSSASVLSSSSSNSEPSPSVDPDQAFENSTDSPKISGSKKARKKKSLGERLKGRGGKGVTEGGEGKESCASSQAGSGGSERGAVDSGAALRVENDNESKSDTSSVTSGLSQLNDPENAPRAVCRAMAASEYHHKVRSKADAIEDNLNDSDDAWVSLAKEDNPHVLSAVLFDWLDQLKEPVLSRQNLTHLLERTDSPRKCLQHLEKYIKHLLEYQALVLSKLFPQEDDEGLERRLAERLLSHLTHSTVLLDPGPFTPPVQPPHHWGEMRGNEAHHLIKFFFTLIDEMASSNT